MKIKNIIVLGHLLAMSMFSSQAAIVNLRCEYLHSPLGIDLSLIHI